jgi:glycosyltransferase involved in cell wall biosynthesis
MLPVPHDQTRGRYIHETARCLAKLATTRVFFQQLRYPNIPLVTPRSYLYGRLDPNYRLDGLEVEAFEYPALPVLTRPFNSLLSARTILPRLRKFAPDLVLAYWVYPDGHAALLAARRLGVPCVVGALGSDIHVRDGLNRWFTRRTIAGVDALLTVSENMRRTAIDTFGAAAAKVHTIVNGYNTAVFHPRPQQLMREKLGVPADARVIAYVGRFVAAKGMRELITVFTTLAARDPKLRLALIGEGVMREELLALVRHAGILDRVMLPGGLPPLGVAEWICAADLLCLPSWSEGYPNVVVEAIACGRPVVATDVGGTAEIVNDACGILVAPRNIESLRSGLERALSTDWDHSGIARAIRRTWDDVATETLDVCEQVIQARGPGQRWAHASAIGTE